MIVFTCQQCSSKLSLPDEHRGKSVKCPKCSTIQKVGDASATPMATSAPAPPADDPFGDIGPAHSAPQGQQSFPASTMSTAPASSSSPFAAGPSYTSPGPAAAAQSTNPYATTSHVGQGYPAPRNLAGRLERLGAAILDVFIIGLTMVPLVIGLAFLANEIAALGILCFVLTGIAFLAVLIVNMVWTTTRGQTIAKSLLGIRIVLENNQPPGFLRGVVLRGWVMSILGQVVPFLPLIDVLLIFAEDHRCIHDHIAGTYVVSA